MTEHYQIDPTPELRQSMLPSQICLEVFVVCKLFKALCPYSACL